MTSQLSALRRLGPAALALAGLVALLLVSTAVLGAATLGARRRADAATAAVDDSLALLRRVRAGTALGSDTLRTQIAALVETPRDRPYVVVSIAENRLWYRQGDSVLFTTRVATGSGKSLVHSGSGETWRFDTPRGRFTVQSRDSMPMWVPPDWHFVEQARKRGVGLVRLEMGDRFSLADGSTILTRKGDLVRRYPDGTQSVLTADDGREIVLGGRLIVPPIGTNQRRYPKILGTRRLNLGDGYALHGTNKPSSIGQAVSHGCVRLRNADIEWLYERVPTGTNVYIY